MSNAAQSFERDLSVEDQGRLEAAHRALRDAVAAYERFLGTELVPGHSIPMHSAGEVKAAQEAVETAENRLWQLREELLGWVRPAWTPSASLTSDWFSEEDSIYDGVPESPAP